MKSIFHAENNKGGVVVNTFAQITKSKSYLVNKPLPPKELERLNKKKIGEKLG